MSTHAPEYLADSELARAIEYLLNGDYEEAHRLLLPLMRIEPSAPVLFYMAWARQAMGYEISARELFRQSLEQGFDFYGLQPPEVQSSDVHTKTRVMKWKDPHGKFQLLFRTMPRRIASLLIKVESLPDLSKMSEEEVGNDESVQKIVTLRKEARPLPPIPTQVQASE